MNDTKKKHCNFTVQVQLVQCTAGSKKFWRNPNFQLHQLQLSSKRFQNNFYKDIRRVNLEQRGLGCLFCKSLRLWPILYRMSEADDTWRYFSAHCKKISVAVSFWYWLFPFFFGVFMLLCVGIYWIFLVCLLEFVGWFLFVWWSLLVGSSLFGGFPSEEWREDGRPLGPHASLSRCSRDTANSVVKALNPDIGIAL